MSVVIDLGNARWAEEPVGRDTLRRYERLPDTPKRIMRDGVSASLWKLKTKSEG